MKNKFDYKKKNSKPNFRFDAGEFSVNENASRKNIGEISIADKGESYSLFGVIEKVVQTGGPTIFSLSDGTGILSLKAFDGAGVRAYPHVDTGDVIKAVVNIEEYNDDLREVVLK
jgi:RecJ-like exonuclease